MAAYEPLRDAFREWNRMIVDGAQFNKQHELNQADQRMREKQLESNLSLQAFNIKMTAVRHELSKRGEQRLADQLALQQNQNTFNQMDRNRNFNRLQRQDKLAEELHGISVQKAKQDLDVSGAKAEKALYETEEVPLDFAGVFDPEKLKDPEYRRGLNEIAHTRGYEIGEDGLAYDADGSQFAIKRYRRSGETPWLLGRAIQMEDTHLDTARRINTIRTQQAALKTELKNSGSDNYNLAERASMKREINKLEGEVAREEKFLTDPTVQSQSYRKKADMLRAVARTVVLDGDTAYAQTLLNEADDYEARIKAMAPTTTGKGGNMVQLFDKDTGESVGKATYNTSSGTWLYDGQAYTRMQDIGNVTDVNPADRNGADATGDKGGMTENQMVNMVYAPLTNQTDKKGMPLLTGVMVPKGNATRELAIKYYKDGMTRIEAANKAMTDVDDMETEFYSESDNLKLIPNTTAGKKAIEMELIQLAEEGIKIDLDKKDRNNFKQLKRAYIGAKKKQFKKMQKEMGIKVPYAPNEAARKFQMALE